MTTPETPDPTDRDAGGLQVQGPVGDWVVVPDGRIGQVWAPAPKRDQWWVAFGTHADVFRYADLRPAEAANYHQEGIQL